jgi:hypothetical protein
MLRHKRRRSSWRLAAGLPAALAAALEGLQGEVLLAEALDVVTDR